MEELGGCCPLGEGGDKMPQEMAKPMASSTQIHPGQGDSVQGMKEIQTQEEPREEPLV